MKKTMKGAIIASAVASMFAVGAFAADKTAKAGGDVKCSGVNDCKGKGACAGANNSCKGQNGCKGQGVTMMKTDDCTKKGGKVVADAAKK
jgi:uncharacterized membrane protein